MKSKILVNYILIPFSILIAINSIRYIFNKNWKSTNPIINAAFNDSFIKNLISNSYLNNSISSTYPYIISNIIKDTTITDKSYFWCNEEKLKFLSTFLAYIGTYLFFHVGIIAFSRLSLNCNPQINKDKVFLSEMNTVIQNTIIHSFLFLGLFLYILFYDSYYKSNNNIYGGYLDLNTRYTISLYAICFLIGRLYYSFGMFVYILTDISAIKKIGTSINIFISISLMFKLFGCECFEKLNNDLLYGN